MSSAASSITKLIDADFALGVRQGEEFVVGLVSHILKKNDTKELEGCLKGSDNLTSGLTNVIIDIAKGEFSISMLMQGVK